MLTLKPYWAITDVQHSTTLRCMASVGWKYIYIPMRGRIKESNWVITKISLGDN